MTHKLQNVRWAHSLARLLCYVLFATALFVVGGYLWDNRDSLAPVLQVPAFLWLIPGILYLAALVGKGLNFDILARVYGVRVPLLDSVGLTASGLLYNYVVPGNASIPLRTLYMHRVLGLHYKEFFPISLAAFTFSTGIYCALAGIAAVVYGEIPSRAYALVVLAFCLGGLGLMLAMALPYHMLPSIGPPLGRLFSGWRRLCRSRKRFGEWLGLILLLAVIEVGLFYSIIWILGIQLTVAQTAIIVLARENSVFLRITPGAFGVAEGVQVFFAMQFGIEPAPILLAAVIARAIELLILSFISLGFAGRLTRQLATRSHDQVTDANAQTRPRGQI